MNPILIAVSQSDEYHMHFSEWMTETAVIVERCTKLNPRFDPISLANSETCLLKPEFAIGRSEVLFRELTAELEDLEVRGSLTDDGTEASVPVTISSSSTLTGISELRGFADLAETNTAPIRLDMDTHPESSDLASEREPYAVKEIYDVFRLHVQDRRRLSLMVMHFVATHFVSIKREIWGHGDMSYEALAIMSTSVCNTVAGTAVPANFRLLEVDDALVAQCADAVARRREWKPKLKDDACYYACKRDHAYANDFQLVLLSLSMSRGENSR